MPDYFFERGRAYLGNRQPVLALADFDQTLKLKADHVPALVVRAGHDAGDVSSRRASGNAGDVMADLNKASATAAKEDDVHFELGTLYSRAGQFGLAVAQYDLWLDKHPPRRQNARCLREPLPRARDVGAGARQSALGLQSRGEGARGCAVLSRQSRDGEPAHGELRQGDRGLRRGADDIQPRNPWALYGRGLAKLHKGQKAAKARRTSRRRRPQGRASWRSFARRGLTP